MSIDDYIILNKYDYDKIEDLLIDLNKYTDEDIIPRPISYSKFEKQINSNAVKENKVLSKKVTELETELSKYTNLDINKVKEELKNTIIEKNIYKNKVDDAEKILERNRHLEYENNWNKSLMEEYNKIEANIIDLIRTYKTFENADYGIIAFGKTIKQLENYLLISREYLDIDSFKQYEDTFDEDDYCYDVSSIKEYLDDKLIELEKIHNNFKNAYNKLKGEINE